MWLILRYIFFLHLAYDYLQTLTSLKELYLDGNPEFDVASLVKLGQLPSLVKLTLAGSAQTTLGKL